jgi:hypothetical protein
MADAHKTLVNAARMRQEVREKRALVMMFRAMD